MRLVTVSEAEKLIRSAISRVKTPMVSLALQECVGLIVAKSIEADRAFPSYDRVMMDGIALSTAGLQEETIRSFAVSGIQRAGQAALTNGSQATCIEVTTGSPMPEGCDAVVPYEDLSSEPGSDIAILRDGVSVRSRQFIHPKGSDIEQGGELVAAGSRLNAPQSALAASAGRAQLDVFESPKIALCSTGDELVAVDQGNPLAHQVRRSNVFSMHHLLAVNGFHDVDFFHFRDDAASMYLRLEEILRSYRFVILSGGVSRGLFDYVPKILGDLKVETIFHGVKQKPGKPMWFGHTEEGGRDCFVFGLPGNPNSSLITLRQYVIEALCAYRGDRGGACFHSASLAHDYEFNPSFVRYLAVSVAQDDLGVLRATAVSTKNSGDAVALGNSDGYLVLPADEKKFSKGSVLPLRLWRARL